MVLARKEYLSVVNNGKAMLSIGVSSFTLRQRKIQQAIFFFCRLKNNKYCTAEMVCERQFLYIVSHNVEISDKPRILLFAHLQTKA